MQTRRRAVIDIGTNSVKLLVAEVVGRSVVPVSEESHQTRLGQGFYQDRCLQPSRIQETARAVSEFAKKAGQLEAAHIRVIATSATREARNADDLSRAILDAAGLAVEIISGEQEAELAFGGISTDESLNGPPVLLLEVGGGSTQFIIGHGGHAHFLHSFPVGSVRLTERFSHGDPPLPSELQCCRDWLRQFFSTEVRPRIQPALEREQAACAGAKSFPMVATGGTASILGCMEARLLSFDRQVLESTRIQQARLEWHVQHLWSLSLAERRQIVGLPPNRADIILFGTAIYEGAMSELGLGELRISTRGLRFGAVLGEP